MKKTLLLFCVEILLGAIAHAQEFTPPDTAAIRENKVKEIRVFYSKGSVHHYLTKTFRYDQQGRLVYEREGTAGYHYEYSYAANEKHYSRAVQRSENGTFIQAWENEYYTDGSVRHTKSFYSANDSLFPTAEYSYDQNGNRIAEWYYNNRKLTRFSQAAFNEKKECTWAKDSIPGLEVSERKTGKLVRVTYYDDKHAAGETWIFNWDEQQRLSQNIRRIPGKNETVFTISYNNSGEPELKKNGRIALPGEKQEWMNSWQGLLPKTQSEEYGLPYSDPVAEERFSHSISRDRRGNITEDRLTNMRPGLNEEPVIFTYEYDFYEKK